jgi:nucleoid-associated protein YgaU
MPVLAIKAVALVAAAGAAVVGGQHEFAGHPQTSQFANGASSIKVVHVYIVKPGDTLSKIAGMFCGNPARYPSLAAASGISNPNVIGVGQRIVLACFRAARAAPAGPPATSGQAPTGSSYAAGSANIPATSQVYSYAGLYRLWIAAGGSPSRAAIAACIAEHESSGRPWVISPTSDYGLWQIHNGGSYMLIPFANAQRAIAMSGNGRNWGQWTTHSMCGV